MPLGESDTRAKLIDPGLHARGWTEDLIHQKETAGVVEVIKAVEMKGKHIPPAHGLE